MNTTAHAVSPEDLMSFLDGELSAAAAETVAAHLAECEECAGIVIQFRGLTQTLSRWTVPDGLPDERERSIEGLARETAYSRLNPWFRDPGSRRLGVAAAGFAVAAAFLVGGLSISQVYRNSMLFWEADMARQAVPSSGHRLTAMDRADRLPTAAINADGAMQEAEVGARRSSLAMYAVSAPPAPKEPVTSTAPMIAHTVNLTIQVKDFAASRSALNQILERHHGYFAQLLVNTQEGGPHSLTASLRIPAPDLASTLAEIRSIGQVLSETQSGEEVTQQHQDLAIRLQNAQQTETRLRAILEQRTGKLADVLAVEEGIARVRGEIEGMEAEQKTLEHRVDFAAIEVQFSEEYKAQISVPDDSTSTRLHNGLVAGYRNASGTILGIVLFLEEFGPTILIWLGILALPVMVWRRYRRLRSKL